MVTKKLFALASVTALTGLMAAVAASGCSSTTTIDPGTGADSSTPTDGGPKADAKKPGDDEEEVDPGSLVCPTKDPIDATQLPWKPPTKNLGACSAQELKDLVAFVDKNDTAKYADWKASVTNTACSGCIFGLESGTTWPPLGENASGELVLLNVGGCIAIASGNDACGKSYQNWFDCGFEACKDCSDDALSACRTKANSLACKEAFDAVSTVCTDAGITDAEKACQGDKFVFEGPITAQCIGLAGEGGG